MWRKNRNFNGGSSCRGVDLNRNYGYQWYTGGSSKNPCSEVYAGTYGNSEPETRAVQSAIMAQFARWDAYVTLHSFGQYL